MTRGFGPSRGALALLLLVLVVGALAAWDATAPEPGIPDVAHAAIRQTYPRDEEAFWKWLEKTIVPRRTTRAEVIEWLGEPHFNLDRPRRDGIVTVQYSLRRLGVNAWTDNLIFDFDRHGRVVQHYAPSLAICGFCPHVYADDGRWRLEGKVLAGCVGREREGEDALLLPRLVPQKGLLRVRLSNLAAEVEYLDRVQLGRVQLGAGEELDVDATGRPFIWKPARPTDTGFDEKALGREGAMLHLDGIPGPRVLVLEVRNTATFEHAERGFLLHHDRPEPAASLLLHFDSGMTQKVSPVGTKLLRRVVVAVPEGVHGVRVQAPGDFWLVRRIWVGSGHCAEEETSWQTAASVKARESGAASLLQQRDGLHLRLRPAQDADLSFFPPGPAPEGQRWGYILRLSGYYEFLPLLRMPGF
jgi:hypothetical protein